MCASRQGEGKASLAEFDKGNAHKHSVCRVVRTFRPLPKTLQLIARNAFIAQTHTDFSLAELFDSADRVLLDTQNIASDYLLFMFHTDVSFILLTR